MEFIEGETLSKRLERGPLAATELLRIAIQICEALEKAHRQGVIHRDLKPGNVMLTKSGAKLLDFGLAKASVAGHERSFLFAHYDPANGWRRAGRGTNYTRNDCWDAAIHVARAA